MITLNALAKKSVEVGDDNPIIGWTKSRGLHHNIEDIAQVYLNREGSTRTFKQGPPTRLNQMPDEMPSSVRSSHPTLDRQLSQGLTATQLVESFQKNNVRRDMTQFVVKDFVDANDPPPHLLSNVQSAQTLNQSRNEDSPKAIIGENLHHHKTTVLPRTEIPQSALRSNPQISTITSIPSDATLETKKNSSTTLRSFRKENVTVKLGRVPSLHLGQA
jgi:hypothetical protein